MIVKIQRPLAWSHEPTALIYNKSRRFWAQVPWDWVKDLFLEDELKIYVKAEHREDGQLEIGDRCPNLDW